jgi:hypothetical protein
VLPRSLPLAALVAVLSLPLLAAPPAAEAARATGPGLDRLTLRVDPGQGPATARRTAHPVVRSATVRLDRGDDAHGWRTDGFRQVGATWRGAEPVLSVRTRAARGRWTSWHRLEPLDDGPDVAAGEGDPALRATDLWWAGQAARDLQLRVRGRGHRDLRLVFIDPGGSAGLTGDLGRPTTARTARTQTRSERPNRAPAPTFLTRRTWGANESWRNSEPYYNRRLEQVHVHHTVNSNDYARSDVAPMIRGIYRYHTQTLGWSDIGYNFLVDRFGRAWVGRAGGAARKVRGAHTLGFNENGTGVAVIGNFEEVRAPRAARWTVAEIAAWKLDMVGKEPSKWRRVWSHGSDRYPRGSHPQLPRVAGHRDTNETACPGRYLYERIGGIRAAAQMRVDRFS